MTMRNLLTGASAACLLAFGAGAAHADEGMWTFDNFPSAAVKSAYGVTIDKPWLDHVQANAVRLSTGCSASIVSGQGLVLTNHHCVADCAQDLSTASSDHLKNGFLTTDGREERQCPGMQAEVLLSIQDVTDPVRKAAEGKAGADFVKARNAAIADIEKSNCAGKEEVRTCQVVNLYQDGQYKLYTFKKYADVRLVFAPELQTAFFGGDPDNFNFPRYDLDMSFVRLYEGGKPIATPDHLVWNPAPPKDGEPTFVAGNPGSTNRLQTADQLDFLRSVTLPMTLTQLAELRGRLIEFGKRGPEQQRVASHELFGIENSYKVYVGQLQALSEPGLLAGKRQADADLKAKVAVDPKLAATIGDPWSKIAAAQTDRAGLYAPYVLLEGRAGFFSPLYGYAVDLVRAGQERAKPNAERLPEYADARLPLLEKEVTDAKPIDPALNQLQIEFWLLKVREVLTADAPQTRLLLGKDSPEDIAARLSKSGLADPATRKALWDGGLPAIQASKDPLIQYVLATDAAARQARKAYEEKVTGPSGQAAQKIAAARFAVYGDKIYPDATFSPRLSYGKVAGWTYRGQTAPSTTVFKGLWERATGKDPFALAPRWEAARGKLKDDTVFDFVTTNDIIGGNSGSPVLNAKGEVIGAAFDGNIHSLGGAFAYDGTINRTVVTSTAGATEAFLQVYGQKALVDELLQGGAKTGTRR
jgi:hypothetical protein